jgi:multiple sugar transport system permease protein
MTRRGLVWRRILGRAGLYGLVGLFLAYILLPVAWMVLSSLLVETDFIKLSSDLTLPRRLQLGYYQALLLPWRTGQIEYGVSAEYGYFLLEALWSTTVVATSVAFGTLLLGSLAAYAFARLRFPGRTALVRAYIAVQMIPGLAVLIPLFIMIRRWDLVDTYLGYILPLIAFFTPFVSWMMLGFIQSIPRDLEDAALVDGCSALGVIARIVLPLSVQGLVASLVWGFLSAWGELMFALVLTGTRVKPVSVMVSLGVGEIQARWGFMSAQAVVTLAVPLVLALIFQRYLVKGLTAGAVTG